MADEPTILPAGEAAIVTTGGMTDWEILVPDCEPDQVMTPAMLLLTACFMRQSDEKWREDMLDWFDKLRESLGVTPSP